MQIRKHFHNVHSIILFCKPFWLVISGTLSEIGLFCVYLEKVRNTKPDVIHVQQNAEIHLESAFILILIS